MNPHFRAINTLVLVEHAQQAEQIAQSLRSTGIAVQQSWVTTATEFSNALRRETFDIGIIHCHDALSHIPAAITRYPTTPFLAVMDRHRNRVAEALLERGVTDVVGLSQPIRMRRVLERLLNEASLRHDNERLRSRQRHQESMLHSVLQNTRQAVAYLHQGAHSYANAAYQSLTGLAQLENVQQTPLLDLIQTQDKQRLVEQLRQIEHGHQTHTTLEVTLVRPDGDTQAVALQLSESFFDDESVVQLVAHPITASPANPVYQPTSEPKGLSPRPTTGKPLAHSPGRSDRHLRIAEFDHTQLVPMGQPINESFGLSEQPAALDDPLDATIAVVPLAAGRSAAFQWHRLNNLRAEVQERILISAAGTASNQADHDKEQQPQNRHLLEQALTWIQRQAEGRPDTQVFVPLDHAALADPQLANWLSRQFTQLCVQPDALAVILPVEGGDAMRWHRLATQLRALGVAISLSGVTEFKAVEALVHQNLVDFVFLSLPAATSETSLEQQIDQYRNADIRTVTTVRRSADIADVWRKGLDCFVDSSRPEISATSLA